MAKLNAKQIPIDYMPTTGEVDKYLHQWDDLENYVNQEKALDKLFFQLCKTNVDLSDILIKCSALNDFYSTNIFDIHSVAKHIFRIPRIDERLVQGDLSLIDEISHVEVGKDKKEHCFYSFASKYCSHHQPFKYAIFDNYVEKVLVYFRKRDHFFEFQNEELRYYPSFISIVRKFQKYYGMEDYNLKQIDKYLWQLGKEYYKRI